MGGAIKSSDINLPERGGTIAKRKQSISIQDLEAQRFNMNSGLDMAALSFEKPKTKLLHDFIPSGSWKGRRCFILGGGPSLKGFDFSKLNGELVIACNRSFESFPSAAIMIAQDARLWGWYESGQLGEEARQKFQQYKGFKSWVNVQAFPYPEDVFIINTTHVRNFNWDDYNYSQGLPWCSNTGLDALCLAVCLGASPIYLLGFDCYGKDGKTANFHAGYPDHNEEKIYKDSMVPNFNDFSPQINAVAKVVNLNPKSELKCFEFGKFSDIKRVKRPLITGCYTVNTKYEQEIKRLEKSLIKFGLEYYFEGIENTGDWRKNVHEKVKFVRRCLDKFDRDIIQMDSDCEIVSYPHLFDKLEGYDIGIYSMPNEVYYVNNERKVMEKMRNVSVCYFRNVKKVRDFVDKWIEKDATLEDPIDDISFSRVIEKHRSLKVFDLPHSYCHIFDRKIDEEPVIDLYQASRRLKNDVMFSEQKSIDDKAQAEKELYSGLWKNGYIPSRCAMPLAAYIAKTADKKMSLLDIGCGDGSTARTLRLMNYNCKGTDITGAGIVIPPETAVVNKPASKWFIEACIWNTGMLDNLFDYTFSTDVLEHLPEDKVDDAIKEIIRITKVKTLHVIAMFKDTRDGVELHKTTRPIDWWEAKFKEYNTKGIQVELMDRAIFLLGD